MLAAIKYTIAAFIAQSRKKVAINIPITSKTFFQFIIYITPWFLSENCILKCNTHSRISIRKESSMSNANKYSHLSKDERNELSVLLNKGYSIRGIADVLGRSPSSLSREIKKNKVVSGEYLSFQAQQKAYVRRRRAKYQGMKIVGNKWLSDYIEEKMRLKWTPEEIAGRLEAEIGYSVISFKAIYKYLYSARGQHLCQFLPSRRYNRRKRGSKKYRKVIIPNRVSIEDRPSIVSHKIRFGDFEADTLGKPKGEPQTITGLVELKTLYFLGCKVQRLKYSMDGFKKVLNPYQKIIKTITFDNGVENARHQELNVRTYFCNPYSSWEKPTVENTFQRLRRFIPKHSKPSDYTAEQISDIIDLMNNTPRKKLNYQTPYEAFQKELSLLNTSVALEG